MNTYRCNICNKSHEIFHAIQSPLPQKIHNIPVSDREWRVKDMQGSYLMDGEIFLLKGDIFIYKKEEDKPFFTWAVWVSISFSDFIVKAEELKERKNVTFAGILESELPFYKKSKGLKVQAIVNIDYDYAVIKILEKSQLKKDQIEAIHTGRIEQLMSKYYHQDN